MAAPAAWRRRLGWRGTALLSYGTLWIIYGIGLMTTPRAGLIRAASVITSLMGLHCWGVAWIVCGLVACVAATRRSGRDTWGFAAAAAPPTIWGLAYLAAGATGEYRQAWASVPLLAAPLGGLLIIAAVTGRRRRICTCEGRRRDGQ
ncbi:hypothetical protein OHV05_24390 [Kitasatospora sp. NBC_00070]|uniref:hypothetical protein n=1 Tax=Kitasatospora sp. NBC_00070 TaxID=2975962 RepID=UPI003253DC10